MSDAWTQWSPQWAPHVVGEYTERTVDPETRAPEEQLYKVTCTTCGSTWGPVTCNSGLVRRHIANFAVAHTHRNPLTKA